MKMPDRWIITGFMASGKTTFGRELARLWNRLFIDLDHYIEEKEGRSVPELFRSVGEQGFRKIESARLQEVIRNNEAMVLSLGGGAICNDQNLNLIKTSGHLVWVKPSTTVLVERLLKKGGTKRPVLLKDDSSERNESEMLEFVKKKSEERQKWYEQADIVLNIDQNLEFQESFQHLLRQLEKHL